MRRAVIKNKGFTLIELMFGVFVLLVSILAALSGFLGSMILNNSSSNLTTAVNDAQYVLEQIKDKGLDYDTCIRYLPNTCYTVPPFTNSSGETNLPYEKVAVGSTPITGSNICETTVIISWEDKGQTRSFSLATYFAK